MNSIQLDGKTYTIHKPIPATKVLPGEIGWVNPRNKKLYIIGITSALKKVAKCNDIQKLARKSL